VMPIPLRLERIATQARDYPEMACTTLAPHLDVALRERAFERLKPQSAPGVERVPWRAYKENREATLKTFPDQLVTETYSPQAVVRRLIPKGGGTCRPLGLPALEDKIVAKAVAMRREGLYEQDVYDFSHGFRPGRTPHQALSEGRQGLLGSRIGQVIACDISSFFDNVEPDTLLAILRQRGKDGRVLK
jgi:RNA-directed DNA polymerase